VREPIAFDIVLYELDDNCDIDGRVVLRAVREGLCPAVEALADQSSCCLLYELCLLVFIVEVVLRAVREGLCPAGGALADTQPP
jgi:hypothetical protein